MCVVWFAASRVRDEDQRGQKVDAVVVGGSNRPVWAAGWKCGRALIPETHS